MTSHIIGTCSLCGGAVVVPNEWMDIQPPCPTCRSCGAYKKESYGKKIEMEKPRRKDHDFR